MLSKMPNGACRTQVRSHSQQLELPRTSETNPLRILEPKRKRLTSLKAERVLTVLEESITNVQIVLTLPEIMIDMQRFKISFGQQLCELIGQLEGLNAKYEYSIELLQEGERLEAEFQEYLKMREKNGSLFSETSSDSGCSEASKEEHVTKVNGLTLATLRRNVVVVKTTLMNCIRSILRKFRTNPTAKKTILEQAGSLCGARDNFIKELTQLHDVVRARLLTSPEELQERIYYIAKVVQRENKIRKMKKKLQIEYDYEVKVKTAEAKKQNSEINMLRQSLKMITETSTTEYASILTEATKKMTADTKSSDGKHQEMLQNSVEAKRLFSERLAFNFADEREKRKRKYKLSTEVFNWIQKYDTDMGTRQDDYNELMIETDGIKKDLEELGRHFVLIEREYDAIMQARRLAEEAEEQRALELEGKTTAIILLQACWRGYRTRRMLRNKNKKGKKDKKDKKK